jgi:hypothetical protein
MSIRLRRRLDAAAHRVGLHGRDHEILVVWDGIREEPWRERVAEARKRGWRVRIVRISLMQVAESVAEADQMVKRHRAERPGVPIDVHDKADHDRILAEWDPGLPEWLQEE